MPEHHPGRGAEDGVDDAGHRRPPGQGKGSTGLRCWKVALRWRGRATTTTSVVVRLEAAVSVTGQLDQEAGAARGRALQGQPATVTVDHVTRQRQPEAVAAPVGLLGPGAEPVEDACRLTGRDARCPCRRRGPRRRRAAARRVRRTSPSGGVCSIALSTRASTARRSATSLPCVRTSPSPGSSTTATRRLRAWSWTLSSRSAHRATRSTERRCQSEPGSATVSSSSTRSVIRATSETTPSASPRTTGSARRLTRRAPQHLGPGGEQRQRGAQLVAGVGDEGALQGQGVRQGTDRPPRQQRAGHGRQGQAGSADDRQDAGERGPLALLRR